jgi:hypothetical protein
MSSIRPMADAAGFKSAAYRVSWISYSVRRVRDGAGFRLSALMAAITTSQRRVHL